MSSKPAKVKVYDGFARTTEHEGVVVDMTLADTAQTQVTLLPEGEGFLIRVWPAKGLHEDGGSNITFFSAVIRSVDGIMTLDGLNVSGYGRVGHPGSEWDG